MAANEHLVGVFRNGIIVGVLGVQPMSKERALNLAAWLVAVACCVDDVDVSSTKARFDELLNEALDS